MAARVVRSGALDCSLSRRKARSHAGCANTPAPTRTGEMQGMASMVVLREITQDSLQAVLDLAVEPEQEQYVAANARSIAEAHFEPRAWFRAVYADDDPVGFVMAFRDPPNEFWVWRFMIDAGHQGKGYGRRALELLVEEARQDGVSEMKLSY